MAKIKTDAREHCPNADCGAGIAYWEHNGNRLVHKPTGQKFCQIDYTCLVCKTVWTEVFGMVHCSRIVYNEEDNSELETYTDIDIDELA